MSAINDALKKTQSALNKQPIPETPVVVNVDSFEKSPAKPSRFSRLFEKIRSAEFLEDAKTRSAEFFDGAKEIIIDFLTNKFFIGAIGSLLLLGISILTFHHIHQFVKHKNVMLQKIQKSESLPASIAPATATEKPVNLVLNGTVHADSKRDAMINNHLYRIGDMVNNYKILEIHYDQVTLLDTETQKTAILTTELS